MVGARVEGDWVEVTVDDDGVGVPEGERALVLEPFHRARNVRESRIPGTGLGLYICRRLVEAHGGRIALLDRPDGQPGHACRIHRAGRARQRSRRVSERILVVEDEPDFASLMTLWMTEAGYEAVTATSGNDALRQFYDHHPDLVVLDLALPGSTAGR